MLLLLMMMGCEVAWQPAPGAYLGGAAPSVEIISPEPQAQLLLGSAVELQGVVSDPDNDSDELSFEVRSDVDGVLTTDVVQEDDSWTAQVQISEGPHEISVRAIDPQGNIGSDQVSVTQLGDQPPTLPELAIEPAVPVSGEALQLVVVVASVDPEGGELQESVSWSRDGLSLPKWDDSFLIPQGIIELGETWTATQTLSDGALETMASVSVSVDNSGPAISITLDPAEPTSSDSVGCTWEALDPDGDPVTAQSARWFVDGEDAGSAKNKRLPAQERGALVECQVSATSSEETVRSKRVTIANSAPQIDSIELTGAPAKEQDSLGCIATASDTDGDSVDIDLIWYVGGTQVAAGEFLDGADFDWGNEVWCAAIASDLQDSAPEVESEHTLILNTAPSKPAVRISPNPAYVGDTLSCVQDTVSTDPDPFDTLTLTWVWKVNGTNVGVSVDSLDTSGLSGGDTVWCKLKVSDGSDKVASTDELDLQGALSGVLSPTDADVRLRGTSSKAAFGHTVIPAGDVDGDGLDDLLISGDNYDSGRGAVWFWSGASVVATSSLDDSDADAWWIGASGSDTLGADQGVGVAGDVDNDGVVDLLMAAPLASGGGTERGVTYLLSGADAGSWGAGGSVDGDAALEISGTTNKDRFGTGLAGVDVNGDGVADLCISAAYEDSGGSASGALFVFQGSGSLSGSLDAGDADVVLSGDSTKDRLGFNAVRALGDVDGDGNDDLLIGAYNADSGAGAAYLLDASSLSSGSVGSQAWLKIEGAATGDNFGVSGAGLDDVDGDGLDEVLVGARFASVDTGDGGGVYLWYGDSGLSGTVNAGSADASWGSDRADARLGWDMSTGDVNGDGSADWSSGAYATVSPSNSGTAWLVSGADYASWSTGMSIDDVAYVQVHGTVGGTYLGRTPVILGDLNGDGYGEWAVSAEGMARSGTKRAGEVGVFFGP